MNPKALIYLRLWLLVLVGWLKMDEMRLIRKRRMAFTLTSLGELANMAGYFFKSLPPAFAYYSIWRFSIRMMIYEW